MLFSTCITIVTSAYQLYWDFDRDLESIHTRLQQIEDVHLNSISASVWTAANDEIQAQLEGIMNLPDMQYVQITEGNKVWARAGVYTDKNIISREYLIRYEHRGEDLSIGNLLAVATLDNAYQHLYNRIWDILVSNAVKTFLVTGFMLYVFNYLVTRNLAHIAGHMRHFDVAGENQPLELPRKTSARPHETDELEQVVSAFESMKNNIREAYRKLLESEEHVKLLLNSTGEGIYGVDVNGACTFVNSAFLSILGYENASAVIGKDVHHLIHHTTHKGVAIADEQCKINIALQAQQSIHVDNEVFWRKNGTCFPVEYRAYPIIKQDVLHGGVVMFFDISHRQAAQQQREQLIKELEYKNTELERFVYTISHDLKAPLVTIKGFAGALRADLQQKNYQRVDDDVERIINAADRLQSLVTDLLNHSRVGHEINRDESVDLHSIIRDVQLNLSELLRNKNVSLDLHDLPVRVTGDAQLIGEVFQNLIENAVKFSANRADPRVEVGVEFRDGAAPVFYVKDNGMGIAPQYHKRVFELFERLDNSVEGTGVGLAIVKRIIGLHNGHVWIESDGDNNGTTVKFNLGQTRE